eukprot:m.185426 g.185426  ORF g.185426 m.185426 type:complete len:750 (-) comp16451_c0_seq1:104-2353(-)
MSSTKHTGPLGHLRMSWRYTHDGAKACVAGRIVAAMSALPPSIDACVKMHVVNEAGKEMKGSKQKFKAVAVDGDTKTMHFDKNFTIDSEWVDGDSARRRLVVALWMPSSGVRKTSKQVGGFSLPFKRLSASHDFVSGWFLVDTDVKWTGVYCGGGETPTEPQGSMGADGDPNDWTMDTSDMPFDGAGPSGDDKVVARQWDKVVHGDDVPQPSAVLACEPSPTVSDGSVRSAVRQERLLRQGGGEESGPTMVDSTCTDDHKDDSACGSSTDDQEDLPPSPDDPALTPSSASPSKNAHSDAAAQHVEMASLWRRLTSLQAEHAKEITVLRRQLQSVKGDYGRSQDELSTVRRQRDGQARKLRAEIATLTAQLATVSTERDTLQERASLVDTLRSDLDAANVKVKQMSAALATAQADVDDAKARLKCAWDEAAAAVAARDTLQAARGRESLTTAGHEPRRGLRRGSQSQPDGGTNVVEASATAKEEDSGRGEGTVVEAAGGGGDVNSKRLVDDHIDTLTADLNTAKATIARLEKAIASLESKNDALEQLASIRLDAVNEATSRAETAEQDATDLESRLEVEERARRAVEEREVALRASYNALKTELDVTVRASHDMQARLDESTTLRTNVEGLRRENEHLHAIIGLKSDANLRQRLLVAERRLNALSSCQSHGKDDTSRGTSNGTAASTSLDGDKPPSTLPQRPRGPSDAGQESSDDLVTKLLDRVAELEDENGGLREYTQKLMVDLLDARS